MDQLQQKIAFSKAKGVNGATARELLERTGGLDGFFSMSQAQLHNLTGLNTAIFADSYRKALLESAESDCVFMREKNIDVHFITDDDYPSRLTECEDAPVLLYKFGSCDLDKAHVVGVVGTRAATRYGLGFTEALVQNLAKNVDDLIIVSGLAYGIDVTAHKTALACGVPTVGVLAHDLNRIYPYEHRQTAASMATHGGALLTEYPLGTGPQRQNFLARNRIVAGLSDCVVVVESDYRGGSMSTARIAAQYNREVFAVPGRTTDKCSHGTNKLIAMHTAALIQSADDLIEMMGWQKKDTAAGEGSTPTLFRALTADEQLLLDFITRYPDVTVNDICVRLGKSYSAVTDVMLQLEMDDIVTTLPGGRYAPKDKF